MKKDFDVRPTASLRNVFRAAGFQDSELYDLYDIYIKNGSLIIKPNISLRTAEKLADAFSRKFLRANYDFEVNPRQRVIACAIGGHVGVAYCSKEDVFSVPIGKALALSRATRTPLPPLLQTYLDLD